MAHGRSGGAGVSSRRDAGDGGSDRGGGRPAQSAEGSGMSSVLILIDLQQDYLRAEDLQPPADAVIAAAGELLEGCRARRVAVMHAWTTIDRASDRRLRHWREMDRWLCVAGTAGHETPAELAPRPGEPVIHKAGYNAFEDGTLARALEASGCDHVILAGVHLHACVRSAAMECLGRNLRVTIAAEAVGSHDPLYAAATRRWLAERSVRFAGVEEILSGLDGRAGERLIHRSPRNLAEALFEVKEASPAEIDAVVGRAFDAQKSWRRSPWAERQRMLWGLCERLEHEAESWARQMAVEVGKPIRHGREEVGRAARNVRDILRLGASVGVGEPVGAAGVRHRPLGVVAVITPWNNPLAIALGKIAAALAYGNTVVWKPSPAGTGLARRLMDELAAAGTSAGVVEMIGGDHTAAQRLAMHRGVDAVTFTGSTPAGHAMQEICGRRMAPLQAELGGNNAAIVWSDADLERAAAQIASGAFGFAGQRCTANRRAIVAEEVYEPFVAEVTAATARLAWGDPLEEATDIGPLISAAHRDRLVGVLDRAKKRAAVREVIVPHERVLTDRPWERMGAYMPPRIVCCEDPADVVVQEEMMGPVLVVQRAGDFERAIGLCNGVRQGLAAAIFTGRKDLQARFREEARAGIVKVNSSTAGVDVGLPFGGWKASGIGPPEHGEGDRLFYTRMQALYTNETIDER
ncbi:MAG: aldehyde dehydrogenase family protein [Thermoleophilia bacterium]|nr:aldehyde dehydrogenase family protein [Thermoleophilia bacterium]